MYCENNEKEITTKQDERKVEDIDNDVKRYIPKKKEIEAKTELEGDPAPSLEEQDGTVAAEENSDEACGEPSNEEADSAGEPELNENDNNDEPNTCADTESEEAETEEDLSYIDEEEDLPEEKNAVSSVISFLYETLEMVAISVAIVIMLITFVMRYSPVNGESMTYTINAGDSLLVQIALYEPKKNDIVILQAPEYDLNKPLVKRVIATGGDELYINFNTWEVKVNGEALDEDYVRYNPYIYNPIGDARVDEMDHQNIYNLPEGTYDSENNTFTATVPSGKIFVMGDNRNNSHDSRSANIGFVDERCVIGKAIFRLYPFSDMEVLE